MKFLARAPVRCDVKSYFRWSGLVVLLAGLPLWAQDAAQTEDASGTEGSSRRVIERVPNFSGFEVLSKSTPQQMKSYPFRVLAGVRNRWLPQLTQLEKTGGWKQGTTVVEFEVNRDGSLGNLKTVESAGEAILDEAASQAISSGAPFPPLPDSYPDKKIRLRLHFGYDPPASAVAPLCHGPNMGAHSAVYVLRKATNGVTAPRATSAPDPEYSDMARRMKYQSAARIAGTVDQEGAFTDLCVLVPAGAGLDEKALETARSWRFEPATIDGSVAPVRINVEVNFQLY
jgi:TonB family protein